MSIFLDDIDALRLYKTKMYLPVNKQDRKCGSAAFLLTKNVDRSIALIEHPLFVNIRSFISYYLERDVMFYITNESMNMTSGIPINESLTTKERNAIIKSKFGIPEDRKFPLDTPAHIKSAITLFGHAEESKKKELAKRIASAAKKNGIEINKSTEVAKYLNEATNVNSTSFFVAEDRIVDRIVPRCGNIKSDHPRWSVYLWNSQTNAEAFAMQKVVRNNLFKCDPQHTLSRPVYDYKAKKFCLIDTEYNKIKRLSNGLDYYVYNTNAHFVKKDGLKENEYACISNPPIMGQVNYLVDNFAFTQVFEKVTKSQYKKLKKIFDAKRDEMHILVNNDDKVYQDELTKAGKMDSAHLTPRRMPDTVFVLDEPDLVQESSIEDEYKVSDFKAHDNQSIIREDGFDASIEGDRYRQFFDEDVDAILEGQKYDNRLRTILFNSRIKTQKEQIVMYDYVKANCPIIDKTYINLGLYKARNLFIDLSYYMNSFFAHNMYKLDTGLDLFVSMLGKVINDNRLEANGYSKKTIFVNIHDWVDTNGIIWDYKLQINPMNMIYRYIKRKEMIKLQQKVGAATWVFMSNTAYFKLDINEMSQIDLAKFISLCTKLQKNDVADADNVEKDSNDVLVTKILDRLDQSGVEVRNFTGGTSKVSADDIKKKLDMGDTITTDPEVKKAMLVTSLKAVAKDSASEEDVYDNIDKETFNKEWLANLVNDLQSDDNININAARASRMNNLNNDMMNKIIEGKSIREYIKQSDAKPIPVDNIPIKSINEDWKDVKFTNFSNTYDINNDIVSIFSSMINKSEPLSIVDIKKKDVSTTEDAIDEWNVKFEDVNGKRHNISINVPKFIDNRTMKLRGDLKTIQGQILLLPIIKTDEDTCQIVSNYNKIFVYRINPSNGSKTNRTVSKIVKILSKYKGNAIDVQEGDNSFTCSKYELPIEYKDLAGLYTKITDTNGSYLCFNQDDMQAIYHPKDISSGEMAIGWDNKEKRWIMMTPKISDTIISFLFEAAGYGHDQNLVDLLESTKGSEKCSYTSASIMNERIPVIVVMAYSEGLQTAMTKGGVKYSFSETRPKSDTYIKFKDGYIQYQDTVSSSLLMTGLVKCPTELYSIKDINKKAMWTDFLENFGGRIKADGLDNFYDLMIDPITKEICDIYKLPTDYVEILGYASSLLADTKYNKHVDLSGNRIRTNEIVAGYVYKVVATAYGNYKNQLKRNKSNAEFSVKKSAVIDAVLSDPTSSDLSILSPDLEAEACNALTSKGLSGMNSDRSYTLDKRIYDDSMLGILGMSTGFAGNVGITRQATINASVANSRGIIAKPKDLNTLNMLSVHEALVPFSTTHDHPMRVAMGFIQGSKHQMRVKRSTPNLVTTGMDEALPYITSNIFSYKFNGKKGKVIDITKEWIIIEDSDTHEREAVSLKDTVMKNSDGGFFVTVKLSPNVKKGETLHNKDVVAYDKTSYSKALGTDKTEKNISYNAGTMAKVAIATTDEAYEDSAIITESLADSLTTDYCVRKDRYLPKDTNVYNLVTKGMPIQEGEPLMVFQNAFDDKDANALMRAITDDDLEAVNDLGRIHVRSKLTGYVQDIKIYRTCELDELSPSLRKIVNAYEKSIRDEAKTLDKNGVNPNGLLDATYKLAPEGKLKAAPDGILIEFYLRCTDKMGIGDKLIYNSALKGVVKKVIPVGDEPTTDFRPNEHIEALITTSGVNARMVGSIIINGLINKIMIETTRQCQDKLGIKWRNLYEIEANYDA